MDKMTTLCAILGTLLACDPSTKAGAQNPPGESAGTDTTLAKLADDLAVALATIETLTNRVAVLESELAQEKQESVTLKKGAAARQIEVNNLQRQVGPLQGSVNNLASAVQSANGVAQANKRYLDQNRATITAAAELLAHVSVEGADVIIEWANLHIRSGAGRTDGEPNGLGNLVIGYGEPTARCDGGYNDRQLCLNGATDCPGGWCVPEDHVTTGSHNLILGVRHQYSSHSCLLVGDGEGRDAPAQPYCARLPTQ